jgi:hypothetical protein
MRPACLQSPTPLLAVHCASSLHHVGNSARRLNPRMSVHCTSSLHPCWEFFTAAQSANVCTLHILFASFWEFFTAAHFIPAPAGFDTLFCTVQFAAVTTTGVVHCLAHCCAVTTTGVVHCLAHCCRALYFVLLHCENAIAESYCTPLVFADSRCLQMPRLPALATVRGATRLRRLLSHVRR